jgi:Right handed beta helix region
MRFAKSLFALFLLATLVVTGDRASAQANVTENQGTYLYVDAQFGSDGNSGAQTSPFKTIQAAINKANVYNQQNVGVKVIVNPGIYREAVYITNYKSTSATLTVQAAVAGTAVIAGSNILTGWTQQTSAIYDTPWAYDLGYCSIPSGWPTNYAPIVQRAEVVAVNGVPLTQVMAFNDLRPGTFYVSDTYSLMHIDPPTGTNMATAVVEAAVRRQTLNVEGRTNVVLRGLAFRHAANCLNTSATSVSGSTNVLLDSLQSSWNNWGGLGVYSSNYVTVQNSVSSYNGGAGILSNRDQNTLLKFNETDYNNWRGAQGAFYDWAMGGTKLFAMHGATVQNQFSYNNQAQGLWFDTDNKSITIQNATLSGNVQAALQLERNEGPITLENSLLCSSGQGVNVLTSQHVTIQNNTFYNNSGTNKFQAEIFIAGTAGGFMLNDWQTGQAYDLLTTGMVLTGNTFENATNGQLVFGTYLGGNDWTTFATTLNSSKNTWYDPTTTNSFKVVNGKVVGLPGWQSAVQTDYTSAWQMPASTPAAACSAPVPALKDFNVNVDSSAYAMSAGKAVATIRVNTFGSGPVTLKAAGMPSGVSAGLSQQSLTSGAVTLTFTSTSTAATQNVPITLFATSGSRVHSVTFYLQVYPL